MSDHDRLPGEGDERHQAQGEPNSGSPAPFGDASNPDLNRPARDMADIARRLLSGARPLPESGRPKRISPKDRANPTPHTTPEKPTPAEKPTEVPITNYQLPITNIPAYQLAPLPTTPDAFTRLTAAATTLAKEHNLPIAFLGISEEDLIIDIAWPSDDSPVLALPESSGGAVDVRVARTLAAIACSVHHWIFAIPVDLLARRSPTDDSSLVDPVAMLQQTVTDILLVTSTDKDAVITAYQTLKRASNAVTLDQRHLRAFIITDDLADAAVVHSRLRSASQYFLRMDLTFAGAAPVPTEWEPLALMHVGPYRTAVWEAVLDLVSDNTRAAPASSIHTDVESALAGLSAAVEQVALDGNDAAAMAAATFDHLANVLDPEERAALAQTFDIRNHVQSDDEPISHAIPSEPIGESFKTQTSSSNEDSSTAVATALETCTLKNEPLPPLRPTSVVGDLASHDVQWQVVVTAAREHMNDPSFIEVSSPLTAESLLALDAAGILHVWTIARDLLAWQALWQWTIEHRHLIALTRRGTPFNPAAPVQFHLVLPPNSPSHTLLRPLPQLSFYRLHTLQLPSQTTLLLVPIA